MNNSVGKYEDGRFVPNLHDSKAIVGYDALSDKFYFVAIDEDGALLTRLQMVNPDTLEWENAVGGESSPTSKYVFSDMDTAGDPSYFGYLDRSGAWYIMQMSESTGETRYARGASGYAAAWSDRAGQSYAYANTTF